MCAVGRVTVGTTEGTEYTEARNELWIRLVFVIVIL